MSRHSQSYDKMKNMIAKLYLLRNSCTGIIYSNKAGENLSWFNGADSILEEAVDELQKALRNLPVANLIVENDINDLAKVERLIRKLDNSTEAESQYS